MMSLGEYPAVGLADAREKALAARKQLDAGQSPVQQKKIARARNVEHGATTFEAVAREMVARETDWSERHAKRFLKHLVDDAFPDIGALPIADVTSAAILKILLRVEKRGAPTAARQLRGQIGRVFRYAIPNLKAENDPTYALRDAIKIRQGAHKKPMDVGAYVTKARSYESPTTGLALELLLLLACRPVELRHMEWEEIDFKDGVWRVPGDKMTKRRPHTAALSKRAVEILESIPHEGRYVFASYAWEGEPMGEKSLNWAMYKLKIDGSPHAVRATFSTWAHENGYDSHVIEAALAHADPNAVRASYNAATYLPQRRELAEAWAKHIDKQAT
jgi:integrase